MDGSRFDLLTRSLTRRSGLRGAVVGLAATLGLAAATDAAPTEEQCLRTGARCGKKSGNNGGPCKKCCTRHWTKGKKRTRCTCKPDGMRCNNSAQCCNGACNPATRICGEATLCIPEDGACPDGNLGCCGDLTCLGGACRAVADCTATLEGAGCEFLDGPGVWDCGGEDLSGVNFNGCDLTGASFSSTNVTNAQFATTILTDANFFGANVTGAVWADTTCPDGPNSDTNGNTCCGAFIFDQTPTGCPVG